MTEFEMKYIGWNLGATRVERHDIKSGIEILELKINGVDVLELLSDSIKSDSVRACPKCSGSGRVEDVCNHLEFTKECELCDGVGKIPAESDNKRMVK